MFTSTERRKVSENILPDWTTLCVENVGVEENFQLGWRKWCCPLNGFLVIFVRIQELFTSYKYASQLKEVLEDSSFLQLVEHFNPEPTHTQGRAHTILIAAVPVLPLPVLFPRSPSSGLCWQGSWSRRDQALKQHPPCALNAVVAGQPEVEEGEQRLNYLRPCQIGWKYSYELMCHHLLYFPPALTHMLRSILRPEEAATNAKTSKPANKSREAGGRGWRWTCSRSSTLPRLSCRAHPLHKYPTPPTFHL